MGIYSYHSTERLQGLRAASRNPCTIVCERGLLEAVRECGNMWFA